MIALKILPSIDKILSWPETKKLTSDYGLPLTKFAAQSSIREFREQMVAGGDAPAVADIVLKMEAMVKSIGSPSLKPVINGTGIILHTNLGRAPFDKGLFDEVKESLTGYNNLELDLETGQRGSRYGHASKILTFITGAEDVLVVNNNAAAILFLLHVFAKGRECIISRGELVEIGGSFRLPEIMEASGSIMREVGATNKTRLSDYKKAINVHTAALLKVHKSNFVMNGFTQEVSISELAPLAREHQILSIYDIGSGLVQKVKHVDFPNEPTVKEAIESGVDLVCFSGDKLFGGCQAGVIAGKSEYINVLKKHPMLRALRVDKTTIAILEAVSLRYLDEKKLLEQNAIFSTKSKDLSQIVSLSEYISENLTLKGIDNRVTCSNGQYGGGAMPDQTIDSYSVVLTLSKELKASGFAKELHIALLQSDKPLLSNLIKGEVHINMLCIGDHQKDTIVDIISNSYEALYHRNGGTRRPR